MAEMEARPRLGAGAGEAVDWQAELLGLAMAAGRRWTWIPPRALTASVLVAQ